MHERAGPNRTGARLRGSTGSSPGGLARASTCAERFAARGAPRRAPTCAERRRLAPAPCGARRGGPSAPADRRATGGPATASASARRSTPAAPVLYERHAHLRGSTGAPREAPTGLDRRMLVHGSRSAQKRMGCTDRAAPRERKGCTSVQSPTEENAREPTYGARPAAPREALMGLDRGRLEDGAH